MLRDWKGSTCLCHSEASLDQQEHPPQDQTDHLQCEVCFVVRFRDMEAHQSTRLKTPSFFPTLRAHSNLSELSETAKLEYALLILHKKCKSL